MASRSRCFYVGMDGPSPHWRGRISHPAGPDPSFRCFSWDYLRLAPDSCSEDPGACCKTSGEPCRPPGCCAATGARFWSSTACCSPLAYVLGSPPKTLSSAPITVWAGTQRWVSTLRLVVVQTGRCNLDVALHREPRPRSSPRTLAKPSSYGNLPSGS